MPMMTQATDVGAALVDEYAPDTVTLSQAYANPGIVNRDFHVGDRFRLTTRTDRMMPLRVHADRAEQMAHLDDRAPGYTWGADDDDPLEFSFTFLGEYEYAGATLDQTTLEILVSFKRVTA